MFLRNLVDESTFSVCSYQRQIQLPQRPMSSKQWKQKQVLYAHEESLNILCNEYNG